MYSLCGLAVNSSSVLGFDTDAGWLLIKFRSHCGCNTESGIADRLTRKLITDKVVQCRMLSLCALFLNENSKLNSAL